MLLIKGKREKREAEIGLTAGAAWRLALNLRGVCFSALGTAASYRVSIQFRKDSFIPSQVCLAERSSM
jgi:hypothetical protein